jgi:hypothetical protein
MTVLEVAFRALLWFAIASLSMVPYFRALSRYRAKSARAGNAGASTRQLLDAPQSDPDLERARWSCIRAALFGEVMILVLSPLMFFFLNR